MAVIADALVGELVKELLGVVIEMKDKARKFRSTLAKLERTLESLGPNVDMLVQQSRKQDQQWDKLIELMVTGRELVLECSTKFPFWNRVQMKADYQDKLEELHGSISMYFQIDMQFKILFLLQNMSVINESHCEQIGSAAVLQRNERIESPPITSKLTGGLDDPQNKLKQLVQEEVSVGSGAPWWKTITMISKKKVKGLSEEVKSAPVLRNQRNEMNVCTASAPPKFTVGLDIPLLELKLRLLREHVSVSVITVTGSGGSGKTTLAKMLCWDHQVKGKYKENVFFVTVAKIPKLNTIVQSLFQHNGYPLPKCQSEEDAFRQLENLMQQIGKKGPMLLVLDDVQVGSEYLVDKFVFSIPNYKVLVTSRSVGGRFGCPYVLERLSREDATSLFLHSASVNPSSSDIPDSVVKTIVNGCKGSPLALTTTGTSLKNKNLAVWCSRAKALSKGQSILESNHDVLTCLQKSLDVLDPIAIECFKDLGLFPEDQRTPAAALVDMWAELRCEDDETAMEIVYELVNQNLADLIVTRKAASDIVDYNFHYVGQHGLLRELAMHLINQEPQDKRNRLIIEINGNELPDWWSVQKEYPIASRILSISTDETFSSKWCNLLPTQVEALVLNIQGKKCTLPMFMKKMNKLKVLIIKNYYFCPAELENFEMLDHLSNLKRLRLEKVTIPFLSKTSVQLKNLQKCYFFMCNGNEAYKNCTGQFSDMLPNLVEMEFDYCTMVQLPVELSNIVLLKNLRITNCHKLSELPEGIGGLINLESLRLSSCTGLLELPDSITSLERLQFLDISDCISLGHLPEGMGKLSNLEKLNVKGCSSLTGLPASILDLENLKDVVCDEEGAELWKPFKEILSGLELHVVQVDFTLDFLRNLRW